MKKSEVTAIFYLVIVALVIACIAAFGALFLVFGLILFLCKCFYMIYEYFYYKSEKFLEVKNSIEENTTKCNELNNHIEKLKEAYTDIKKVDYGNASYTDNSNYNYKRPELNKLTNSRYTHECSATVCKGAQSQPFKYICKYFDIKANEETLVNFENVLNNFSAAEEGKKLLQEERDAIIDNISPNIPTLIMNFGKKKLINKVGFNDIDFSQLYFPKYSFNYVSPGGNSSTSCDIVFDIDNLDRFINYLSELVKFKKSITGQRALMTLSLREKIKSRDNYTCQNCGLSTKQEPNLLLEIDHIIPLSKNGITSEENLQTLCWKCNRSKGSKIIESDLKSDIKINS